MIKRTGQEIVLLSMSALSAAVIFPFIFIRLASGDWSMVIVNVVIIIAMLSFFLFVYKTRKVDLASLIMSLLLMGTAVFDIIIKGPSTIYWFYPVIMAIFYLNSQKTATVICSVSMAAMSFVLFPQIPIVEFLTIFVSVLLTNIFSFVIFRSYNETQKKLKLFATTDSLTSAGNRRALDRQLSDLILSQQREEYKMCLILLDLDHFKKINDNYGHALGDDILVAVSKLIATNIRALDSFYRYGGEEFILAPLKVDLQTAGVVAENLRVIIENSQYPSHISVTISLGVAEYHQGETAEEWIARADSALYLAKDTGRNKVCLAE